MLVVWSPEADRVRAESALRTLVATFEGALRLLSPFMPFLTEELWQAVYEGKPPLASIALAAYPEGMEAEPCSDIVALQAMVTDIRALRKELGVEEKAAIAVRIRPIGPAAEASLREVRDVVERLARVSSLEVAAGKLEGPGVRSSPGFDVQVVYEKQIDAAAERERLGKQLAKLEKERKGAEAQLGDAGFLAKAPATVVEGRRKRLGEVDELIAKARAALDGLNGKAS